MLPIRFSMRYLSLFLAVAIHTAYAATGAIPLTNHEELWYGSIQVGSPAVAYTVVFDTASADLYLPSPECSTNCDGHTKYNPSASSTAHDLGNTFSINFGDGSSAHGELYSDTVSIGGLTTTGQTLGAAKEYPVSLAPSQFPADGILGMAFQQISESGAAPVVETLISNGQTDKPVFSFKLAATGSELYIGGANSALYKGVFTYTKVTVVGYWQTELDAITINGEALPGMSVIIDTGSTGILLSQSEAATFYSHVPGSKDASSSVGPGHYTFPCSSGLSVAFTFGGRSFPMSQSSFSQGPVTQGSSDCVGNIIGGDTESFAVIGTSFLQNVYTTFDMGDNQVGFAELA